MKFTKLLTAGLLALALAGPASAQTVLKITGSSAFRGATYQAMARVLNSPFHVAYQGNPSTVGTGVPAPYSKATSAVFIGTVKTASNGLPAGTSVVIQCYFTGSVGGVLTLDTNVVPPFYGNTGTNKGGWMSTTQNVGGVPTDMATYSNSVATETTGGYSISSLGSVLLDPAVTATASMSDTFQNTTAYNATNLIDQIVGVVTFAWAKGAGAPSTIDNMTTSLAYNLLNGGLPLGQMTGNSADESYYVFCIGRDEDSGTRYGAFAEAQFGVFSSPQQYEVFGSPATTSTDLFHGQTINGVYYGPGHSGYASGGNLITALNTPIAGAANPGTPTATNSLKTWFCGYAGVLDLSGLTNVGAASLPYNGVAFNDTNVKQGKYSFWEYEHMFYRPALAGTQKGLADQIATQIKTSTADTSGVIVTQMKYGKQVEGGPIFSGNPYP